MNKSLFKTKDAKYRSIAPANAVNAAGGKAYSKTSENALASYVATSFLNGTFYHSDKDQLNTILSLTKECSTEYVAACALYGREIARMKDTPALLAAVLTTRGPEGLDLLEEIFPRVINNVKMLMNFVRIIRSGVVGRQSLGYRARNIIRKRLASWNSYQLFMQSIGQDPSLTDVIKLAHANPGSPDRQALFKYLMGYTEHMDYFEDDLPEIVQTFEAFKDALKNGGDAEIPKVPFQMLTALPLQKQHWIEIARNAPWNMLRMNLNTFKRHGVLDDSKIVNMLADRLKDPKLVRQNNAFPYQLFTTYQNTTDVPMPLRLALQDAVEVATENIPIFGRVAVAVDTSGSMQCAVTGNRGSVTSKTRCVDAASLIATSILRKNPNTLVLPFDTVLHGLNALNPRDSVVTNAEKLANFGGGGTNCAIPLSYLNQESWIGDVVIMLSDNESWAQHRRSYGYGTCMAEEWRRIKSRNQNCKLILVDLAVNPTTQVNDDKNVFNVGGFSDSLWRGIDLFVKGHNLDFNKLVMEHYKNSSRNSDSSLDETDDS